jgi:hypothetical protein
MSDRLDFRGDEEEPQEIPPPQYRVELDTRNLTGLATFVLVLISMAFGNFVVFTVQKLSQLAGQVDDQDLAYDAMQSTYDANFREIWQEAEQAKLKELELEHRLEGLEDRLEGLAYRLEHLTSSTGEVGQLWKGRKTANEVMVCQGRQLGKLEQKVDEVWTKLGLQEPCQEDDGGRAAKRKRERPQNNPVSKTNM